MTLVSSAIPNDLDVAGYVKRVLDALLGGETNYKGLLSHRWAADHPEQIRRYRKQQGRRSPQRHRCCPLRPDPA